MADLPDFTEFKNYLKSLPKPEQRKYLLEQINAVFTGKKQRKFIDALNRGELLDQQYSELRDNMNDSKSYKKSMEREHARQ